MHHDLKAEPDSFKLMAFRTSEVQLRKNDRNFNVGDTCTFYEWTNGIFTGHTIKPVPINTVLKEHEGLTPGWCLIVLSIPMTDICRFNGEISGKTRIEQIVETGAP